MITKTYTQTTNETNHSVMWVILNGKLIPAKDAKISVFDHGFLYGDAIFETIRTVKGEPWMLREHLSRLRKSARVLGLKIGWTNAELEKMINRLCKKNGFKESRIRITLSRGCNNFEFSTCKKPTLLIEAKKLVRPLLEIYKKGVTAITYEIERSYPSIKSVSMLPAIIARREAKKRKVFESILINQKGYVTEGSISNIFVVKNGKLMTPKNEVLEGTIRNYLMKKMPVKLTNISQKQLAASDEVFLTSSLKGVVPIVKINGKNVGNGKVGPVTKAAMEIINTI